MPRKFLFSSTAKIKMPSNKVSQPRREIKMPPERPLKTHKWKWNATQIPFPP